MAAVEQWSLVMITIPYDENQSNNSWWFNVLSDGRKQVVTRCENGHIGSLVTHKIAADGTVWPSVVCQHKDCNFHEFIRLMEFISQTRKEGRIKVSYGCEGYLADYEMEVRDAPFFCQAGIHIGSVLANGDISACPSLRGDYVQGNIYRDNFLDVWNTRFQVMRNRKWTKTGKCANCKAYKYCQGNGLHLRDEKTGELLQCHLEMMGKSAIEPGSGSRLKLAEVLRFFT